MGGRDFESRARDGRCILFVTYLESGAFEFAGERESPHGVNALPLRSSRGEKRSVLKVAHQGYVLGVAGRKHRD